MKKPNVNIVKMLILTAEIYGRNMSEAAAEILVDDLGGYDEHDVLEALSRCRRELRSFPSVADIVLRIHDGRPGVEEAWAMCPRSEGQSAVWTSETRDAFFSSAPLLIEDPVAARMAFKEKYSELVTNARAKRTPIKWHYSAGHDKLGQEAVLSDAVAKGRISADQAKLFLPDISFAADRSTPRLGGPQKVDAQKLLETARKESV